MQHMGVAAASAGFANAQAAFTHTETTLCHVAQPCLVKRMAMRLLETDKVNIPFNKSAHNLTMPAPREDGEEAGQVFCLEATQATQRLVMKVVGMAAAQEALIILEQSCQIRTDICAKR